MPNARHQLILRHPASWWGSLWREALPCGNGRIGAAVYGGVSRETVLLNHAGLWHGTRRAELPDVSASLAETRRLMASGKYREANRVLVDALDNTGYTASVGSVLPLGDLKVEMPAGRGFTRYSRRLDMGTGEVVVRWQDGDDEFERSLFVSRSADMVVYELRATGRPIEARVTIGLHDFEDSNGLRDEDVVTKNLVTRGELESVLEVRAEADTLSCASRNGDGADFGAVARIVCVDGGTGAVGNAIQIAGSRRDQGMYPNVALESQDQPARARELSR